MLLYVGENNSAVEDGRYAFLIRKIEVINNVTYNYNVFLEDNNTVFFSPIIGGTLLPEQNWELQKFNYRRGDSNADENYDITDATHIQSYLYQSITLNKLEYFLSDADYDGYVTVLDSTKIQRILTGVDVY